MPKALVAFANGAIVTDPPVSRLIVRLPPASVTGSETVRRSDPDGYTLLFNASLFVLGKTILPSCPYDPQTDFRPIAQAGDTAIHAHATRADPFLDRAPRGQAGRGDQLLEALAFRRRLRRRQAR